MPGIYFEQFLDLLDQGQKADSVAAPTVQRPQEFTSTNSTVINTVNVAIAPPAPTVGNLAPTIQYAQVISESSVAQFGTQSTPVVVTLLETLDDAANLGQYLIQPIPRFWFGNIQILMNALTDAQKTTISNLDIGSQVTVTKSFPNSTPATVTQTMAIEGISHVISQDQHIVMLYPNPARIFTLFILNSSVLNDDTKGLG